MKRFIAMLLVFALLACGGYAFAEGGGASDPLISLSYLLETLKNDIISKTESKTEEQVGGVIDSYIARLEASANFQSSNMLHTTQFAELLLEESAAVELGRFACFMPAVGKMVLRVEQGDVIDISTGNTVPDGTIMTIGHKYFAAENAVARVVSYTPEAYGFVDGYYNPIEPMGFLDNDMFYDMFDHWGKEYVYELYNSGVVNGVDDHRFAPNTTVTRGMLVTILGRVYGVNTAIYNDSGFADVEIGKWYGPYVAWARDCGIVDGYEDGSFKPETNINREQMALIFMRFANYVGAALSAEQVDAFADEEKISSWALDAVLYAQSTGLINGRDGNLFDPLGTATRAEICAVTSRFIAKYRNTALS